MKHGITQLAVQYHCFQKETGLILALVLVLKNVFI